MLVLLFDKIGCRSRKARGQRIWSSHFPLFLHEAFLYDCFNTANVDEVKGKRSPAGLFHPLFPVPLGEPHQFLRLPESRPGEGPRKKEFGEVSG